MTRINPSFGRRGYWHLIDGAPLEGPAEATKSLLTLAHAMKDRSGVWPIEPCVIRAMAVELVIEASWQGQPLSDDLVELLAWAADLPTLALTDPPAFYEGGWKGGAAPKSPEAKVHALALDREYFQAKGEWMPRSKLESLLKERLGETSAPVWSTLNRWRKDPKYHETVTL